jgi:hypothetical protein
MLDGLGRKYMCVMQGENRAMLDGLGCKYLCVMHGANQAILGELQLNCTTCMQIQRKSSLVSNSNNRQCWST